MVHRFMLFMSAIALVPTGTALAEPPVRTVMVSARSEVRVVPDLLAADLMVSTEHRELQQAKRSNDEKTAAVLALTRKFAVSKDDVQVKDISVGAVYKDPQKPSPETLRGHAFARILEVRLKDFSKVEPFLGEALAIGSVSLHGIEFRTTKHREHHGEARRNAVTYAKEKAAHLAELTDIRLGKPLTIDMRAEPSTKYEGAYAARVAPSVLREPRDLKSGPLVSAVTDAAEDRVVFRLASLQQEKKEKSETAVGQPATERYEITFAPGQLVISAEVTITFELLP